VPNQRPLRTVFEAMAHHQLGHGYAIFAGRLEEFANARLFPSESLFIARAGPRRLATFRGGRACARVALRDLGLAPVAIGTNAYGAPVWPPTVVGSISHRNEFAVALVAHSPPIRGLGIDLERDELLEDPAMVRIICRPDELDSAYDAHHPANLGRGKLIFAVKEAVYKAYSAIKDTFLDFHEIRVSLDESAGTFCATVVDPQGWKDIEPRFVRGNLARSEGLFIAIASQPWPGEKTLARPQDPGIASSQ
jgi:4'-phosphopantetheinyl transferase EntD